MRLAMSTAWINAQLSRQRWSRNIQYTTGPAVGIDGEEEDGFRVRIRPGWTAAQETEAAVVVIAIGEPSEVTAGKNNIDGANFATEFEIPTKFSYIIKNLNKNGLYRGKREEGYLLSCVEKYGGRN